MDAHWWKAILFATTIAAYGGFMWIMFAFVVHAHKRIVIMLDTGYFWKDAGAILRRESRKKHGPRPGTHRAPSAKQHKRASAEVLSIEDHAATWEDPHGEDVIEALKRVDAQAHYDSDLLGDAVPHSNVDVKRDPTVPMGMAPTDLPDTRTIEMGEAHARR